MQFQLPTALNVHFCCCKRVRNKKKLKSFTFENGYSCTHDIKKRDYT